MSDVTLSTAGGMLVLLPTVALGGASLLRFLRRGTPGYFDNPLRRSFFRAGHAHAGVLLIFALVALPYVDAAGMTGLSESITRACLALPPILMPAGFFLSVASPAATRPNWLIYLVYVGGVALAVGALTLGLALLR